MGADGDGVARFDFLGLLVDDDDLWVEIFLVLGDDHAFFTGLLVCFVRNSDAGDHVAEFDLTVFLGEDGYVIRIPSDNRIALLHVFAILHGNHGADNDLMAF